VFLGNRPGGRIGRTVSGAVDINQDGTDDVMFSGAGVGFVYDGDGPKGKSIERPSGGPKTLQVVALRTPVDSQLAIEVFGGLALFPGEEGDIGELNIGPAGDINNDGVDDLMIGAPEADPGGRTDAGKVYAVFGTPALFVKQEVLLSDIGVTEAGFTVSGFEDGDQLGAALSGGFDLNGDGVDDAVIGAPFADALAGTPGNAGETYLLSPISPDEVMQLDLKPWMGSTLIEWTTTDRAVGYNVYRGELSLLRAASRAGTFAWCSTPGACRLRCDHNDMLPDYDDDSNSLPDLADNDVPAPGEAFVYLVTGENHVGEGPIGSSGSGPTRLNDGECP